MKIERFEDIEAWQLAWELTRKVNERKVTLNLELVNAYKDVYEQARRTRAAVRGFINYLKKYGERKVANREPRLPSGGQA